MELSKWCEICANKGCTKGGVPDMGDMKPSCYSEDKKSSKKESNPTERTSFFS